MEVSGGSEENLDLEVKSMNKCLLMGRLTKDPDVRYSQGENSTCVARYSLAVDRRVGKKDGEVPTDFISCVAFGKSGEFAEKYLKKGMKVAVCGRIQTGNYEKDGKKVYTTDVVVEEHYFCESKNSGENSGGEVSGNDEEFMKIDGESNLPF